MSLIDEEQRLQMVYVSNWQDMKCKDAKYSHDEDPVMIRSKVEATEGGRERLNDRMARFRMPRQTRDVEKAASANA